MRAILGVLGLSILLTTASFAQQRPETTGIKDVISSQLDAFRDDDLETAFSYASPSIKGIFGTPRRFGQMVRQGYPMVYRPADVTYLELDVTGGVKRQKVLIRDTGGAFHVLLYDMIEMDGIWRINGVRLLEAPQVGA